MRSRLKKGGEEDISEIKRLLSEFKEVMQEIKKLPVQAVCDGPKLPATFKGDEPSSFDRMKADMSYNQAQVLLTSATSSFELQKAWEQINAQINWPSWQLKELYKLKENQRTKIDF